MKTLLEIPELAGMSEAMAAKLVDYAIGQVLSEHAPFGHKFAPEGCLRCAVKLPPEKREKYLRIFFSDEVEF